jgi:hypothetical protein
MLRIAHDNGIKLPLGHRVKQAILPLSRDIRIEHRGRLSPPTDL